MLDAAVNFSLKWKMLLPLAAMLMIQAVMAGWSLWLLSAQDTDGQVVNVARPPAHALSSEDN